MILGGVPLRVLECRGSRRGFRLWGSGLSASQTDVDGCGDFAERTSGRPIPVSRSLRLTSCREGFQDRAVRTCILCGTPAVLSSVRLGGGWDDRDAAVLLRMLCRVASRCKDQATRIKTMRGSPTWCRRLSFNFERYAVIGNLEILRSLSHQPPQPFHLSRL